MFTHVSTLRMNVFVEFCWVTCKVVWAFVLAGAKWILRPKEKDVEGQVCIITGGGSTLGRLFAMEFARRGATVVLWDLRRQSMEETAETVRQIHERDAPLRRPKVYTFECDVSKPEDVYLTAERVLHEVGSVDILVNNGGAVSGHHLLNCPDEQIQHSMMVNCHAHFWTTKAFLPKMLEMNNGHIVTVASSLGLFNTAGAEDYCASTFGAVGFHESLSHELKATEKEGIKMTLVCPSLVDNREEIGPMSPPSKAEHCVKQAMRAILTDQPMICTPRVMYIVTFLKTVLPFDAIVCMYRFLGADKCMYPILAHRTDIMNNNQTRSET